MLNNALPSTHQIDRQFSRGLQDRQLAVCIRHDDVDFRDEKYSVADPSFRHQDMTGNRSHILDATDTANKKLRHYGRLQNIQRHVCCPLAGVVVFVAGRARMHGPKPYTSYKSRVAQPCTQSVIRCGEETTNGLATPRCGERRLTFVGHQSLRNSNSNADPSRLHSDTAGALPLQAPAGQFTNSSGYKLDTKSPSAHRKSANTENDHVDRSALRAGHAGQTLYALSGQVKPRNRARTLVDMNASLAAREGEKSLHILPPNPHSNTTPIAFRRRG